MKRHRTTARQFLLCVAVAVSACCFAQTPAWVTKPEKEFPTEQFVRALESGSTAQNAKSAALASISLYFNTKTDIVSVAVKQMESVVSGDSKLLSSGQSFSQIARISSSAEFFCVNFTDGWFDKKSGKHYVLAYIDKQEAAGVYRVRTNAIMEAISIYRSSAEKTPEPLLAVRFLSKAQVLGTIASRYIQNEITLVPSVAKSRTDDLETLSKISAAADEMKSRIRFSILSASDDARLRPLYECVSSVLEKNGCSYSLENPSYFVIVDTEFLQEENEAGKFVRPNIKIIIENKNRTGVYSYSKSYQRVGSKTFDNAVARAVGKVCADVEEHFFTD